jgi:Tfp pilus assembly protein PilN
MAQNINLYEAPRKQARQGVSPQRVAAIAGLLVVTLGTLHWVDRQRTAQLAAELAQLRATHDRISRQTAALPADTAAAQQLQQDERDIAALEQIAARLTAGALGRSDAFTAHLQALARSTTDGVWLTGIRIDNASKTLELEGRALDPARVPQLFTALRNEPLFGGLAFSAFELKAVELTPKDPAAADTTRSQLVRFRIRTPDPVVAGATPASPATPTQATSAGSAAAGAALMTPGGRP